MILVNAMGDACPIPVIKTKKAIEKMTSLETVEVLVDNEIAAENVTKLAKNLGGIITKTIIKEGEIKLNILMNSVVEQPEESIDYLPTKRNDIVIAISSDKMGVGSDELGKVLMKGFIFAVTQLEELPKTVLFYNGGAALTAEESDSLEDLKELEAQGVEIMTCGTCLNYYNLANELRVGSVTNMYQIVERMNEASKVITP